MPRKSNKNAARYATTSVVKPKTPSPPSSPKMEMVIEEKIDPYRYFTSEVFYFETPLPEIDLFQVVGFYNGVSYSSSYIKGELIRLEQEEVPSVKYDCKHTICARSTYETFYAGDLRVLDTNYTPINSGWILSSGEANLTKTPDQIRKMFAYKVAIRYLPENMKYSICHLNLLKDNIHMVVGSFVPEN